MSTGRSNRIKACLLTLLLAAGLTGQADAVGTSAAAAVLMDVDSGRVLYAQNPDKQMLIASTTKIMTALLAVQHLEPALQLKVGIDEFHSEVFGRQSPERTFAAVLDAEKKQRPWD